MRVTSGRIARVAADYRSLHLLDMAEVDDVEPAEDSRTPYAQFQSVAKRLPVIPESHGDPRWACRACGRCCHGLTVELTSEEEARIDPSLYPDLLGPDPFAEWVFLDPEQPARRALRQKKNGACIFLDNQGLCAIHARQGMSAKPDPCQIFPHVVVHVPDGPPRLTLRLNCDSMHETFEKGPLPEAHQANVQRVAHGAPTLQAPRKVSVFGRTWTFNRFNQWLFRAIHILEDEGFRAESLREIDHALLGGRVRRSRRRFGRNMLRYVVAERSSDIPVEAGGFGPQLARVRRGEEAFQAMARGALPPRVASRTEAFLSRQAIQALYGLGPLQLSDAGLGLTALVLAFESILHAVGPRGRLKTANTAFLVLTGPFLETTHQSWPALESIDPDYTRRLKEEL